MSDSAYDLSKSFVDLPQFVVIDTNVVAEWVLGSYQQASQRTFRVRSFFQDIVSSHREAILTPTGYSEFLHVAIIARYRTVFRQQGRAALTKQHGVEIRNERQLLKRDPSILQRYAGDLQLLVQSLRDGNVVVANPEQLSPIPTGRTHQEELLHIITQYGLDTNDALILMEASRLGVRSVVSMDSDMLRASSDFDVFTWLS